MKMIDGDKLRKHLDYLIEKDNQFAKMCDGNDDYSRQRKYCFEVDVLAYELCKSEMDYYLVKDVQPIRHGRWVECCNELDKKCSCCDKVHGTIYEKEQFCPTCGARMDGDTE